MNDNDDRLRQLLRHNILEAPPSPWFTRKVLNRLPPKKVRWAARIEYLLYILGIVATTVYGIIFVSALNEQPAVTVGDITSLALILALFTSLIYMTIAPFYHDGAIDEIR